MKKGYLMHRRISLVSLVLIVGLVSGALPAAAQEEAPATWGQIKQLYGVQENPVLRGAGVSPGAAEAAHRSALAHARAPFSGPVVVKTLARSPEGVILAVYTRTAAGVEAAHLIAGDGRYLRGVEWDPAEGLLRDAVTGVTLGRLDPGQIPDPYGVNDILRDLARRAGSMACNAVATVVMEKCLAATLITIPLPGAFGCVAAGAAVLLACEAMMNMHYILEDQEMGEPGLEYAPGGSPGDTSGG
jgi:hypothetical protein